MALPHRPGISAKREPDAAHEHQRAPSSVDCQLPLGRKGAVNDHHRPPISLTCLRVLRGISPGLVRTRIARHPRLGDRLRHRWQPAGAGASTDRA
jgi:hypothetical protein